MNRTLLALYSLMASLALALVALHAAPALAQGTMVTVTKAWVRPASKAVGTSAFYAIITNAGAEPDRLDAASTPVAGMAQVHQTKAGKGGMMYMLHLPKGLKVPAHGSVELKPGGYHVMLMQLKEDIAAGSTIPVTLHFAHAGAIVVQAQVANQVPGAAMDQMPMDAMSKDEMSTGAKPKDQAAPGGMSKEQMGH
ncbi:MAG TPA: copper chaperone PCu(A)C [bacterium]|nr:copper chaperone PCu(A)C [bacterium]